MSVAEDDYEPTATVWRAVAELEKKQYTKREIYDALRAVADGSGGIRENLNG